MTLDAQGEIVDLLGDRDAALQVLLRLFELPAEVAADSCECEGRSDLEPAVARTGCEYLRLCQPAPRLRAFALSMDEAGEPDERIAAEVEPADVEGPLGDESKPLPR